MQTLSAVSEFIGVAKEKFEATGAFNIILGSDTKLFVDPFLLPKSAVPEFKGGRDKLLEYFSKIALLIRMSKSHEEATWKEADKLLSFPEAPGFNLGYGGEGSHGSGMGKKIRSQTLETAKEIIAKGIVEPEIFELVGIFEEGIGADRISDMVCWVLREDFLQYSDRVYRDLGLKVERPYKSGDKLYNIPENPFKPGEPIILVPRDVLRELPVAYDFDGISHVCATNAELRDKVNSLLGDDWKEKHKHLPKKELRKLLLDNPEILRELIEIYRKSNGESYDFQSDPKDIIAGYFHARELVQQHPMALALASNPTQKEILAVVEKICGRFQEHIEDRGLWRDLYREEPNYTRPRTEKTAQRLFQVVATEHCDANDLDLSPEVNSGRGSVDFKVSRGASRVLVEIKLSTNKNLEHAFEQQVPIYQKVERTSDAIILVVQVKEESLPLKRLRERADQLKREGQSHPIIFVVDGLPKDSASIA